MNKRGSDIPSLIFAIAIIFTIGIMLVVISNLSLQIYSNLNTVLNENENIASSEANLTLTKVQNFEQSMWDYFFLAIVMGYVFSMITLAFITPSNPWFFAIFVIVGSLGLFIGVGLSNAWEKFAEQEILSSTIDRFPITDLLLNNFYPLFIAIIFIAIMVMLFGKRFLGGEGAR